MNEKLLEYCKQEIDSLIKKKLIRPSKSPWSCATFYVQNAAEIERGACHELYTALPYSWIALV